MTALHLSHTQSLPLEVVTEKLAWIGVTGSGKSYGASKLAELLWANHAQFIVLDPVGVWWGLRLAKDGKTAGVPIPVFGGLHGDVPLEPTGGALVADLIVDKDLSVVLDVSQFESDTQKARFVSDFAERFYQRKKASPSAVHVFLEEAQEFVPQNPQRGEEMMLHRLHRMQKLGRNFGIGTSIITQRPQETSKKALNQAQTVFAFRLTGSQERKAVEIWIEDKGLDQDLIASLPKIETGHCHVWSPAWLKVSKMIHIAPKQTFDASATPKVGELRAARTLAPIDLERLRTAMAATIEKAKDENPRLLRDRIRQLEADLSRAAKIPKEAGVKIHRVEVPVPVVKEADVKRLEVTICRAEGMLDKTRDALLAMAKLVEKAAHPLVVVAPAAMPPIGYQQRTRAHGPAANSAPRQAPPPLARAPRPDDGSLTGPQQKILAALVFLEGIGATPTDKCQVALFVGVRHTSGSYAKNLATLKNTGRIEYPGGGNLLITEEGRAAAPDVDLPKTTEALHAVVLNMVSGPQQKILEQAIAAYPEPVSKEDVAAACGVSATSGSYAKNMAELNTIGVITYPSVGKIRAAKFLYID